MPISKELLKSCLENDRRAQHLLYKECFSFLMRVGYRYAKDKDDAVSLLNLAFLKILTQLEKYNEDIQFEFWAKKIMVNTVIDEYRKKKKYDETFVAKDWSDDSEQHYFIDKDRADKKYDVEEILNLIKSLPPASQNVFNLFVIDGYSHKEIAGKMKISEGTSKWHLAEARKLLIKKIESGVISILLLL